MMIDSALGNSLATDFPQPSTDQQRSHQLDFSALANSRADSKSSDRAELIVNGWLEALLRRFTVRQLDVTSDQALSSLLSQCRETLPFAFPVEERVSGDGSHEPQAFGDLRTCYLLSELRRRILRLMGAQLDNAFISMSPRIVDEADLEQVDLPVECCHLQGGRYRGDVYRLVETFKPCYRLQAYCLCQTLSEQADSFLMTRSAERFAVWTNVKTSPQAKVSVSQSSLSSRSLSQN
ncbi:MAG: hypothetical protein AAFY72_05575 [Cyanobacteria bacterium J06649_4]